MAPLSIDPDDALTSQWGRGAAWDEKVARAQARLDARPAAARLHDPCGDTCQIPEVRRLALRPLD